MPMRIQPLYDRIVLEKIEEESRSAGGIVIPDQAKERPQRGVVVAVGEGRVLDDGTRRPPAVKVGDRVLFAKYGGTEVKADGKDYLIVREDDVLAVLG